MSKFNSNINITEMSREEMVKMYSNITEQIQNNQKMLKELEEHIGKYSERISPDLKLERNVLFITAESSENNKYQYGYNSAMPYKKAYDCLPICLEYNSYTAVIDDIIDADEDDGDQKFSGKSWANIDYVIGQTQTSIEALKQFEVALQKAKLNGAEYVVYKELANEDDRDSYHWQWN